MDDDPSPISLLRSRHLVRVNCCKIETCQFLEHNFIRVRVRNLSPTYYRKIGDRKKRIETAFLFLIYYRTHRSQVKAWLFNRVTTTEHRTAKRN